MTSVLPCHALTSLPLHVRVRPPRGVERPPDGLQMLVLSPITGVAYDPASGTAFPLPDLVVRSLQMRGVASTEGGHEGPASEGSAGSPAAPRLAKVDALVSAVAKGIFLLRGEAGDDWDGEVSDALTSSASEQPSVAGASPLTPASSTVVVASKPGGVCKDPATVADWLRSVNFLTQGCADDDDNEGRATPAAEVMSPSQFRAAKAACRSRLALARQRHCVARRAWRAFSSSAVGGLSAICSVLEAHGTDLPLVELALAVLYNLLHPSAGVRVQPEVVMVASPATEKQRPPADGAEPPLPSGPAFATHRAASGPHAPPYAVRAEVSRMFRGPLPALVLPATPPSAANAASSGPVPCLLSGFTVIRTRSAVVAARLHRRGILRIVFTLLQRMAADGSPSEESLAADGAAAKALEHRVLYYSALLLAALAGASEGQEGHWVSQRCAAGAIAACPSGGVASSAGANGPEDSDDEDDDSAPKKGKKKKGACRPHGGGLSGPVRTPAGASLTKAATLGRLTGGIAVIAAGYVDACAQNVAVEGGTHEQTVPVAEGLRHWNTAVLVAAPPDAHIAACPSAGGIVAATAAALAVCAAGEANISYILKRGVVPAICGQLEPTRAEGAGDAEVRQRWSVELLVRLLSPAVTKAGLVVPQPTADDAALLREALRDRVCAALVLQVAASAARAPPTNSPYPALPISVALFCAATDAAYLLLQLPAATAALRGHVTSVATVATALSEAAVACAPEATRGVRSARIPLAAADWAVLVNQAMRLYDVRELPVGSDGDLVWLPPPEVVEQLRRQQQEAAATAGAKGVPDVPSSDDSSSTDSSDDADDADGPPDSVTQVEGMADLSPELRGTAALDVPTHTNILGILNVHHVKPFAAPRPLPSSSGVVNSPPPPLEPLLVMSEGERAAVVQAQLMRLLVPCKPAVVYDDVARNTQLPRIRYPPVATAATSPAPPPAHAAVLASLARLCGSGHPAGTASSTAALSFQSNFESGNLKRAIRVQDREYDLILQADINTNSFTQWFYFSVGEAVPNVPYRFNIVNMEKAASTFNDGQRPLLFSERRYSATEHRVAWTRAGTHICYYPNSLARRGRTRAAVDILSPTSAGGGCGGSSGAGAGGAEGTAAGSGGGTNISGSSAKKAKTKAKPGLGTYYTLSFTITFPDAGPADRCYLTNCYPYSYSDLIGYCRRLLTQHEEASKGAAARRASAVAGPSTGAPSAHGPASPKVAPHCLYIQNLCATLSGNATPLLTITSLLTAGGVPVPSDVMRQRPVVLLTARVHPGESNASYVIKGLLDLLLHPTAPMARELRDTYVWKIVPMLNPDGVVNGNHRCGLAGRDLNREYHTPSRWRFPTIFFLKALVHRLKVREGRSVALYTDFHGHSRCQNSVIYGCGDNNTLHSLFFGLAPKTAPAASLASSSSIADSSAANKAGGGKGNPPPPRATTSNANSRTRSVSGTGTAAQPVAKKAIPAGSQHGPGARFGVFAASQHPFTAGGCGVAPERLLPRVLSYVLPFFSYDSSTFTMQKGKRRTGRVVLYRQMGVRMSFTFEASMMGGVGGDYLLSSAAEGATDDARRRAAALWAVEHRQLSGLASPAECAAGRGGSCAAHFNHHHYATMGMAFLRTIHAVTAAYAGTAAALPPPELATASLRAMAASGEVPSVAHAAAAIMAAEKAVSKSTAIIPKRRKKKAKAPRPPIPRAPAKRPNPSTRASAATAQRGAAAPTKAVLEKSTPFSGSYASSARRGSQVPSTKSTPKGPPSAAPAASSEALVGAAEAAVAVSDAESQEEESDASNEEDAELDEELEEAAAEGDVDLDPAAEADGSAGDGAELPVVERPPEPPAPVAPLEDVLSILRAAFASGGVFITPLDEQPPGQAQPTRPNTTPTTHAKGAKR